MTGSYALSRAAFQEFSKALASDNDLRADVLTALSNLLTRYNTLIYENRFIVGGVAERIIAATFVAMGQTAKKVGVSVTRTDIRVGDAHLSVKGSFRPKTSTVRMINVLGDSADAAWDEPTVFIVSQRGIGYADPDLLPDATSRSKDAILLKSKALYALWADRPEFLIPMPIPFSLDDMSKSDIASRIVADEILRYTKRLKPFDTRTHFD